MFTKETINTTKTTAPPKPTPVDASFAEATHEQNPLWQSLALNATALQPKLIVSQPDDPYEREADLVAERVMRMPALPSGALQSPNPQSGNTKLPYAFKVPSKVQRKCDHCEEEERLQRKEAEPQALGVQMKSLAISAAIDPDEKEADEVALKVVDGTSTEILGKGDAVKRKGEGSVETTPEFQSKLDGSKGGGQPLPRDVQVEVGGRMGTDISDVRVHAGSAADEMSKSINARAFTLGGDIYFRQGEYSSDSDNGRRLLVHELAHTVHQTGGIRRQISDPQKEVKIEQVSADSKKPNTGGDVIDVDEKEAEGYCNYHGQLRVIRQDIKVFSPLTTGQIAEYPWNEAIDVFTAVHDVGGEISQKTFEQWVRRNLIDGWQPGDEAYRLDGPAWEVGKKNGLWVIDAYSSDEAFAYMNQEHGVGSQYYWRRRISGELLLRRVVFDQSAPDDREKDYVKAVQGGFVGTQALFDQLYNGSYELYEASLIAEYGQAQLQEYQKALKGGFIGTLDQFIRLFEGKYQIYAENKSLLSGEVDDVDETSLNRRMQLAKLSGTVIGSFEKEAFRLAVVRLKRNIERIGQWKNYVLSISAKNVYESGKTAAYTGLKTGAQENDREWILNQWLDQPDANVRNVQENFIVGQFKGGAQYCHSMNRALQLPGKTTATPLEQLSSLQQPASSDTGTVWSFNQAPRTKLTGAEIQKLRTYLKTLPEKGGSKTPSTSASAVGSAKLSPSRKTPIAQGTAYPSIKTADSIVGHLNQVLSVLGFGGYNVIPLYVFSDPKQMTPENMRAQIVTAIDGRISDYQGLIKDIQANEIKIHELAPVVNELLAAITDNEIKEEINTHVVIQQTIETAKNVGKVVITIAGMLVGVPPVLLAAAWLGEGVSMVQHGSSLTQAEGATNVMDPETVAAGHEMIVAGILTIMTSVFDIGLQAGALTSTTRISLQTPTVISKGTKFGISGSVVEADYIFVPKGPNSFIVRQSDVVNQYAVVTRNPKTMTDVCELYEYKPASKTWVLEGVETRPWGKGNVLGVEPATDQSKALTAAPPIKEQVFDQETVKGNLPYKQTPEKQLGQEPKKDKPVRSRYFRPEGFEQIAKVGIKIPETYEPLFQVHHVIEHSLVKDDILGDFLEKIGFDIDNSQQNGFPLLRFSYAQIKKLNPKVVPVSPDKEFLELSMMFPDKDYAKIVEEFPDIVIWEKLPKHKGPHPKTYNKMLKERLHRIRTKWLVNQDNAKALANVEAVVSHMAGMMDRQKLLFRKNN